MSCHFFYLQSIHGHTLLYILWIISLVLIAIGVSVSANQVSFLNSCSSLRCVRCVRCVHEIVTSHLMVWLKEALRTWLLSLEKLRQVTPLLWACSNLRRHKPLWIFHTFGNNAHIFQEVRWWDFDLNSIVNSDINTYYCRQYSTSPPLFCHFELQLPADLYPDWSTCTARLHPSSWSCPGPGTLDPDSSMQIHTHTQVHTRIRKAKVAAFKHCYTGNINRLHASN